MNQFEKPGGLKDSVGEYFSGKVPQELNWNHLGHSILEEVDKRRKKNKRLLPFWWLGGMAILLFLFYQYNHPANIELQSLPIPQLGQINTDQNLMLPDDLSTGSISIPRNKTTTEADNLLIPPVPGKHWFNPKSPRIFSTQKMPSLVKAVDTTIKNENLHLLPIGDFPFQALRALSLESKPSMELFQSQEEFPFLAKLDIPLESDSKLDLGQSLLKPLRKIHPKWRLELSGGTNILDFNPSRSTGDGLNPVSKDHSLLGKQFSIRLKRSLYPNWNVSTGLGYQQLRFRSRYYREEHVSLYRPNTIDTIFISALTGERAFSYTDSIPGIRTRNFQHFNQHELIQIPILVGYTLAHKKMSLGLNTGLNFTLLHTPKGRVLYTSMEATELSEPALFAKNLKFSLLIEAQLNYRFIRNTDLFIRFGYESHQRSWTNAPYVHLQQPKLVYSDLGISCRF